MSFDVACSGGDANGAWFSGHALTGKPPQTIEVAVGSDAGPALLDLPDDELELGERIVVYELHGVAIVCSRGRGGCCRNVATYRPQS